MLTRTLLRKWYHQLPPPVITLIRRLRRLPVTTVVAHTKESWEQGCQEMLQTMGGSSEAEQGQFRITWPVTTTGLELNAFVRTHPSSDLDVFGQVWHRRQYRAVTDYMKAWVSTKDELRIVDAGANVGFTTLYLKSEFPNSHIICLEPEDSNYIQLTKNISENRMSGVTLLKAGLWKRPAYLEVGRDVGDQREWSFYVKEVPHTTELRGYDVQFLMKQANWNQLDLLKIDIEGAERYLFANDGTAAETLRSARFLAIEIHDNFHIRPRIYNCLDKNGFDYFDNGELTIGRNKGLVLDEHLRTISV
jgi:FkbM family methyltransferase